MAPNTPLDLPARRYRLLVEQLRDELGGEHGWKEKVARRLDVSGAFVGYVASGERNAGATATKKAEKKLGLHFRFFHDPSLGERPDYRDHIVSGPEAHWQTFRARFSQIDQLSDKQLDDIKQFAARNLEVKSWTDYKDLAEMVLRDTESPTFERNRH